MQLPYYLRDAARSPLLGLAVAVLGALLGRWGLAPAVLGLSFYLVETRDEWREHRSTQIWIITAITALHALTWYRATLLDPWTGTGLVFDQDAFATATGIHLVRGLIVAGFAVGIVAYGVALLGAMLLGAAESRSRVGEGLLLLLAIVGVLWLGRRLAPSLYDAAFGRFVGLDDDFQVIVVTGPDQIELRHGVRPTRLLRRADVRRLEVRCVVKVESDSDGVVHHHTIATTLSLTDGTTLRHHGLRSTQERQDEQAAHTSAKTLAAMPGWGDLVTSTPCVLAPDGQDPK